MNKEDLKMAAIVTFGILTLILTAGLAGDRNMNAKHEARMLCIEQGGVWLRFEQSCAWNKPPPPWTIPVLEGGGF